jgi:hypothetical protein
MKHIKEIRTFTTFNELYKDFINTLNVEDTDTNRSVIYKEIESKGLIEDNNILFIYDEFNLLN